MADVDIQCMSCGNQITVSEVVNVANLKCRACGGEFLRTEAGAATTEPSPDEKRRSLMGTATAESKPTSTQPPASESPKADPAKEEANRLAWEKLNNPEAQKEVQRQSRKAYSSLTWKAWVMFIVVGAIAGFLRYGGVIPPETLEKAILYEALTVIVLQIFIVLKAFQDSVFQGVLCILLPPYAFYYLFSASDDFYLRALIAGLMVGLGQDAGLTFHAWSISTIEAVNSWIASGG